MFTSASSRKTKVCCGGLESAYFTKGRLSRRLIMRQPRSGRHVGAMEQGSIARTTSSQMGWRIRNAGVSRLPASWRRCGTFCSILKMTRC